MTGPQAPLQWPKLPQRDNCQSFAEEGGVIVAGTMQDMHDDHLCVINRVEDQVVVGNVPADTMMFIAWGDSEGVDHEIFAPAPQLPDE